MKNLLSLVLLGILTISVHAQQLMSVTSLAANTSSNVLSSPAIIDNLTLLNATTNTAICYFFDSSTTATNYVQAAYTSYASYATNYSVVFTNEANVLVTNTFSGVYTAPTANSLATNTRPVLTALVVPAGTSLNKDVKLQTIRGLTAIPNQALTLVTTYRKTY